MLNMVNIWLAIVRQKALHKGGEGLIELALGLSSNGVENQRRFARARHTCKDRNLLFGNVERNILEAVSYTHLDVYKRQVCSVILHRSSFTPQQPLPNLLSMGTVSYTHLDVYKRQQVAWA